MRSSLLLLSDIFTLGSVVTSPVSNPVWAAERSPTGWDQSIPGPTVPCLERSCYQHWQGHLEDTWRLVLTSYKARTVRVVLTSNSKPSRHWLTSSLLRNSDWEARGTLFAIGLVHHSRSCHMFVVLLVLTLSLPLTASDAHLDYQGT